VTILICGLSRLIKSRRQVPKDVVLVQLLTAESVLSAQLSRRIWLRLIVSDSCISPNLVPRAEPDLSTNGTCQLEKTENFTSKAPRRTRYTVRNRVTPRSKESRKNHNMFEMFGITVRLRCCQQN
jgi:hypothetical protein